MTLTMPETDRQLKMAAVGTEIPTKFYARNAYETSYSPRLVLTGKNYYDCKTIADAQGIGISASYEELAMQLAYENAGIDPGQEETFNDLFGRNEDKIYIWQWTRNGLRVPTGQEPEKYETDKRGRKRWKRIFLEGDKEVAELWVPEGNDHVVTEWNELFGVPAATEDISWPHKPYTTHFVFSTNPKKDDISGHYDVAVGRRCDWHHGEPRRCLYVDAHYGRWDALSSDGFRPVRGSAPKIEVVSSSVDAEGIRREITEKMHLEFASDLRKLPAQDLLEKYKQ